MKKNKHLIVRITEEQLNRLIIKLKEDNKRKSTLLRELIDLYLKRELS